MKLRRASKNSRKQSVETIVKIVDIESRKRLFIRVGAYKGALMTSNGKYQMEIVVRAEATSCLCVAILSLCSTAGIASAIGVGDFIKVAANTNVRVAPGTGSNEIEDSDYYGVAQAGTRGKITAGPQTANGFTWWRVDFGPGLYSGWAVQNGLEVTASPARVALTLYVYDGSVTGPLIPGARVTGQDGGANTFDQTTNASGYVTVFGLPGTWRFLAAKDSYQPSSWSQDITSTCTRYAFLSKPSAPQQSSNPHSPVIATPRPSGNPRQVASDGQKDAAVIAEAMKYIMPHEGYREQAYRDSRQIWTVGYGLNLQDVTAFDRLRRVGANNAADKVRQQRFSEVVLDKTKARDLLRLTVQDCVNQARAIWRRAYATQPVFAEFDALPLDAKLVALDMIYQLGAFESERWYAFFPPFDETIIPKTYGGSATRLENSDDLKRWRDQSGAVRVQDHVNKLRRLDQQSGQVKVLDVPFFSQLNSNWADEFLGPSDGKIKDYGCAITSVAMVLKYHGVETDPKELNEMLKANKGFTPEGDLKWGEVPNVFNGRIEGPKYISRPINLSFVYESIAKKRPSVVNVTFKNKKNMTVNHYLVFWGIGNNDYYFYDPADIVRTPRNWPNGAMGRVYSLGKSIRVYYRSTSGLSDGETPTIDALPDMSDTQANVLGRWVDDRNSGLAETVTLQFEQDGTVLMSGPIGSVQSRGSGYSCGQWQLENDSKMSFRLFRFTGYPTLTASAQIEGDKLKDFKMGGSQPGLPLMKSTNAQRIKAVAKGTLWNEYVRDTPGLVSTMLLRLRQDGNFLAIMYVKWKWKMLGRDSVQLYMHSPAVGVIEHTKFRLQGNRLVDDVCGASYRRVASSPK